MPYGGTYTDQILQRAGISNPTTVQVQLARAMSNQIEAGQWSFDQAVEEFRVQIGQLPRSEYGIPEQEGRIPTGSQTGGGTSGGLEDDPLGNASDVQLILMQYGGLSALEAQQAIAENPITAAKFAQQLLEDAGISGGGGGGGSGGGSVRTQFPSESRLENANAAQIEQELAAIAAGTSRFQPFQGGYFDPQTGDFFDPSDVGLGRFNADTSRLNATTQQQLAAHQTGPAFQEGIRQFDQELALNALGEERAGKTAAANAEIGFGNLGVDRAEFIRNVLNSPSDTLARLYMQRGGTSPLAKIEMADLLNSFNRQATNISNSVSRFAPNAALKGATIPGAKVPAITPTTTPKVNPEYAFANQPFITPTYSDPTNYLSPEGDPWGPEAQSRLETGLQEGSIVNADPNLTPSNYSYDPNGGMDASSDFNFEIRDGNLVAVPAHAAGGYTQESRFIVGDQRSGKPTGHEELIVNPTNAPIQVVSNRDLPNVSRFYGGSPKGKKKKRDVGDELDEQGDNLAIWKVINELDKLRPSMTKSRMGKARDLVDYDSINRSIQGEGPNDKWRQDDRELSMLEDYWRIYNESRGIPRYDEGTGSFGDLRPKVLDAEPTGGFLNSLKEALGDAGEGFSKLQARNRATTKQGLVDFPIDREAATGAAMGMAGYESAGPSRLFPRKMTPAERVKMAEEKGLPVDNIPLVERLQAQYEKARQEVIDLIDTKASQADLSKNKPRVDAARAKAKELSSLLDEEKARVKEGGQSVQEAMMDDYSNTLKQYKLISKHADNVVERQTGGMFKTFAEFDNYYNELAEQVSSQRNLPPEKIQELQTLLKLDNHKTIKALRDLDNQLNTVGQQMGQMRGGREGVENIEPGKNTIDSIRRALDPNDEINRYAKGTSRFSRYAEGTLFPTYNDTHSLFPTGDVTQQQLIDMSRIGTGPGGTSVLSGQMPDRFRIPGLQTPTAMQFSSLSGAERENLRPRLAAEFTSTLEDLMFDIEQRYSTGPSRMAKFRG